MPGNRGVNYSFSHPKRLAMDDLHWIKCTERVRELEAERDRLNNEIERLEREHQDCGIAVAALSRCVREAIDALPPDLARNTKGDKALATWVAVLRRWGIDPCRGPEINSP